MTVSLLGNNHSRSAATSAGRSLPADVWHDLVHEIATVRADDNLLRDALGLGAETTRTHAHFLASYLTPREREVLGCLVAGMTTVAIGRQMAISKTTVRAHVQSILGKFGVHSRLEAVSYAVANGIIDPPT